MNSYGGATALNSGGMSIRSKARLSLIKAGVKVAILCVVFLWVFPLYIAPDLLGITPAVYEENRFVLGIVAGVVSAPFMWLSDKILDYQMAK